MADHASRYYASKRSWNVAEVENIWFLLDQKAVAEAAKHLGEIAKLVKILFIRL